MLNPRPLKSGMITWTMPLLQDVSDSGSESDTGDNVTDDGQ